MTAPAIGTYVLASKYADGDPGDHFCIGYYNGIVRRGVNWKRLESEHAFEA